MDFLNRVDIKGVGKSVIERLIQSGALDRLGVSRETLQGNFERAIEYAQSKQDDKKFGQTNLFDDPGTSEFPDFEFEPFPEMSRMDKLNLEKQLIGFYFSGHPMDEYRPLWERAVKLDLGRPETFVPGNYLFVGLIKSLKTITTGKGGKMAFAALADFKGEVELTFFPRIWEDCQDKIAEDRIAVIRGKLEYQQDKDRHNVVAEECISLNDVEAQLEKEEAQARKWDKYRNIWKYAAGLDLRIPDLSAPGKSTPGANPAGGLLKSLRAPTDKNGKEMAFGVLEDPRGEIDLVFFSRTWENCKALAAVDEMLALKGSIEPPRNKERGQEKPSFLVSSILDLNKLVRAAAKKAAGDNTAEARDGQADSADNKEDSAEKGLIKETMETMKNQNAAGAPAPAVYRELHIKLRQDAAQDEANLSPLLDCLIENPGPCAVYIHVPVPSGEQVIRTATQLSASADPARLEAFSRCAAVAEAWGR
jgi:DNA polymerase-3 subunit alpha